MGKTEWKTGVAEAIDTTKTLLFLSMAGRDTRGDEMINMESWVVLSHSR